MTEHRSVLHGLNGWIPQTPLVGGCCLCAKEVPKYINCDERNQKSSLSQGSCTFFDSEENAIVGSQCPFVFSTSATENGLFLLPPTVSELNSVVCGNMSREVKGPLCGRCTNNTGPSVYSVGSRCVPCSPVNILYYILLQYLPSTVIFLLVVIFMPNVTSAPREMFVLFCNFTVLYARTRLWKYYLQQKGIVSYLALPTITLSAIWSFDSLFVSPPLCISQHMEKNFMPILEFISAVYPFVLLSFAYGSIHLHFSRLV